MNDSHSIARILGAIRSRDERPAGAASVSPKALGTREGQREITPAKFQRTGKAELNDGAPDVVRAPIERWADVCRCAFDPCYPNERSPLCGCPEEALMEAR